MSVESVAQVIRGENFLKAPVFVDMTTPQDCPRRVVVKQHRRKECGQESFYMLTIHS